MTYVWGFGLLGATAVACVLVFALPIRTYLLVSPFVGYGIMGMLVLWTLWYTRRERKRRTSLRVRLTGGRWGERARMDASASWCTVSVPILSGR